MNRAERLGVTIAMIVAAAPPDAIGIQFELYLCPLPAPRESVYEGGR